MLEPRKKKKKLRKKWAIALPIVLVLISSVLVLNGKVLSEQTEPKRYISYNDQQWEMESQPSEEIWTNKDNISFVVNLEDDYGRIENKAEINPEVDKPISVSAKQGENTIDNVAITPQVIGEVFTGLYNVTVPVTADGAVMINVEIAQHEKWNNPASEGSFNILRDKTDPTADLIGKSGTVNGDYYTEDVTLTAVVNETNLSPNSIKIYRKKNDEAEEYLTVDAAEGGEYTKDLSFKENGDYIVNIKATDKAGNKVDNTYEFTISKEGNQPDVTILNLTDGGSIIKNFAHSNNIKINVNSQVSMSEANFVLIKDNIEVLNRVIEVKGRTTSLEYDLSQNGLENPDGNYQIKVTVKDKRGNILEPATYSFVIDNTPPEFTYNVDNDEVVKQKKDVAIELEEKNIQSSTIAVTMQKVDGTVVPIVESKNGDATFTASEEGEYTIKLEASDKAGNILIDTDPIKFKVENESAPDITIKAKTLSGETYANEEINGQYFNNDTEIDFKAIDITLTEAILSLTKGDSEPENIPLNKGLFWANTNQTFTENGQYTVEMNAKDLFNNPSSKGPYTFTIDKNPPKLEIFNFEESGEYGGKQEFTIKVKDENFDFENTKITVLRDGMEPGEKEKPEILKIKEEGLDGALFKFSYDIDGNYEINFDIQDKATNRPVNDSAIKFTIDKESPNLILDKRLEDNSHYPGLKDVAFTIEDLTLDWEESVVTVTKEDGTITEYKDWKKGNKGRLKTAYQTIDFEEEGDYKVEFKGFDKKENDYSIKTIHFTIDTTSPEIKFSGINEGDFVTSDEIIDVLIKEHNHESMNVEVYYTVNGGKEKKLEWMDNGESSENPYSFNGDGQYVFTVVATDKAENRSTLSRTFTIDDTPPKIEITDTSREYYSNKGREIKIKVDELNFVKNKVDIDLKVNGKPVLFKGDWNREGIRSFIVDEFDADGDYEIKVTAEDKAGNPAKTEKHQFTIDMTKPQVELETEIENGLNYKRNMLVKMKVEDRNINLSNTDLEVKKDGKTYNVGKLKLLGDSKTKAYNSYTFFEEGEYEINLKSTDKAGNTKKHEQLAFIIDKTNPVVKIDGVDNNSFNPENKNVTISIDELNFETNNVSVSATKDGAAFSIGTWKNREKLSKLGYNFTRDGLYTILATAEDKAGNGPITEKRTFTIDKTKPEIEITGVENNAYYNVDKPVNATIKDVNLDINRITVTRNGARYNAGGFSVNGDLASFRHNFSGEGEYNILVEATDKAGNSFSKTMTFTIDKTKPVIMPKFKGQNRVIKDGEYINEVFTPEFALDEAEDMIVSATLNNGANLGKNIPVAAREMKYIYKVLARDKAGNESTLEISFTLDTTKPALNISGVLDGFFNKDITPKVTYSDIHLDSSKTSVTLNGKPFENGTKLEYEQDYILKVVITDLAKNVSSRTIVFTIDKTKPVIKFKEPISNKYFNTDLLPQLLIDDMSSYDIIAMMLDGKPYEKGDPIKEEGKHVMFFEVKDKAGNIQQLSVEFIIDKTAPKVVYEGVKNKGKYHDPIDIAIRLDNPNDKIKSVMINGEMFDGDVIEENGFKVIKTKLAEIKSYEIKVTASDEAGNEKTTVISFEIVEKGALVKFYENKPLLGGTVAGLVGLIGAAATMMVRRRKLKVEEE
ncbi:Ig-like domain repeat protein [Bacillus sp. ISL-35]|uniref:Ig-like domain-containing protein n=1 Tax=Bacillus sp. ISL-35 TaxID=2819122 RepID=UPI001BECB466|nr:Ig-like domain-containing protein [Bacillus sp. ISL-35]MBT2678676.1 Ig-like domain repeat protein [Bacillus sp. ISL-35]MBT2703668.1 Ig-like domain repeat protein [Chryseobacterium sp. ISL-80]